MERIGKNVASLGLSRVISGLILFVVYIRLVTYLGPSEFGKFSLVLAYYTIFLLLVDLGISRYVIKKVSEDKSLAPAYLGNFFVAQFFISLLVLLCFVFIPRLLHYEAEFRPAMFLTGFGLFIYSLSIPFASLVQAWQKIHIVAAVNFLNTLINAAWLLLVVLWHKNFAFIFWLYPVIGAADLLVYFYLVERVVSVSFHLEWPLVKKMILFGLPFAFISGFEILVAKADVIIQKFFLHFSQVGLYSSAYRFLDILTFIPAIIAISLFPFLAEHADLDTDDVRANLNRWNRYMAAVALPIGVGVTILADKIILVLFHSSYIGAVRPLQILIWSSVITFIYAVPNVIMIVKQTRRTISILALGTVFNIAANLFLIPRYGILASAWLTVLSYLLVGFGYIYYSRKLVKYHLFRYFAWPVAMSAVMGIVLWFLRAHSLWALLAVAAAVYFAGLVAVNFLKREDWHFLKAIVGREESPL